MIRNKSLLFGSLARVAPSLNTRILFLFLLDDQLLEVAELRVHGCLFVQIFVQPLKRSTVCVVALGRKVVENSTLVDPNINKAND